MLDLHSSMPRLSGYHTYYLTLTGLKWFNVDQLRRFVYNDFARTSSVTSMLNNLNWPLLQQRRDIAKVIMFYKIINNLISIPHDHITISPVSTRGHNLKYIQLAAKSNTYLFSFFPSAIKLWNSLPDFVINSTNLNNFKLHLDNYFSK